MLHVPTALLLHQTPTGSHHDWLVGTPENYSKPRSGLWTARVSPPSRCWRGLGQFGLTLLDSHRRMYLDYQGPIAGGRGNVTRVDRGDAVIHLWRVGLIVWELHLQHFTGVIEAARMADHAWRARVID